MTEKNLDTDADALFGDPHEPLPGSLGGMDPFSTPSPATPSGATVQAQVAATATAVKEDDQAFEDLEERVSTEQFDDQIQDSIKRGAVVKDQLTQRTLAYRAAEYVRTKDAQVTRQLQREELLRRIGGYRALIQEGRTNTITTAVLDREVSLCQQQMAERNGELKSIDASVVKLDGDITKYRQQRSKLVAECDQFNGTYRAKKKETERLERDVLGLATDLKSLEPSQPEYQKKRDQKVDGETAIEKERQELAILEAYLPKGLSDEELRSIVSAVMVTGETNFGKIMGQVMLQVAGRADGAKVSQIVKDELEKHS